MYGMNPLMEVSDLQRTIAFYRDVLGFEVQATWTEGGAPSSCRPSRGDAAMMFSTGPGADTPSMTGRFYFYPEDTAA